LIDQAFEPVQGGVRVIIPVRFAAIGHVIVDVSTRSRPAAQCEHALRRDVRFGLGPGRQAMAADPVRKSGVVVANRERTAERPATDFVI
jgi:hypothetical protein